MMRAFFSLVAITFLFAVSANAQSFSTYKKYERHPLYWQGQYLKDQMNAQSLEDYLDRKRQQFYKNQSGLVKFIEWDPYK
jgi:hypothetical protein